MARKSKHSKPTEIDLDEVRAYLRADKAGHQDSNLPRSVEILRDSDDEFYKEILRQLIFDADIEGKFEPVHSEAPPPSVKKEERERKPDALSRIVKALIYKQEVTQEEMDSLLRHIRKRVYKRFIQIQNMIIDRATTLFDVYEITQTIMASMYAKDGFFNYLRMKNPEPNKVKNEIIWQKFDHRLDEKINNMYDKFLHRVLKGILDAGAIKPDEDGDVDFGRIHWTGSMAKKDRSDEWEE
jgi:hypothetical protein